MHAVAHSFAHRAPPATRARVRWQPYNSIPPSSVASSSSSSSSSTASSSNLSPTISSITPDSSISLSPHPTPLCDIDPPSLPSTSTLQTPKDIPARDPPRNKHALGLVDQAVKSLCEIWRPQDIPSVFFSSGGGLVPLSASLEHTRLPPQSPSVSHLPTRNAQLPSAFPTAPSSASSSALHSHAPTTQALLHSADSDADTRSMAVPIKGFVHEVLRRSRTSGHVLQTALCYLEAIRPKIPEWVQKEKTGEAAQLEVELESRIVPATEAELAQERAFESALSTDAQYTVQVADTLLDTIRVSDSSSEPEPQSMRSDMSFSQLISSGTAVSPLPRLPTPLLCPRRAFLAALILASKFTQDKCYSNRAWAKLSGLPAREISRCERALGDALDWRLWVGKSSQSKASSQPAAAQRPMVRTSSESALFKSTLIGGERKHAVCTKADDAPSSTRSLRKCVTMPAEAFAFSRGISARTRMVREKFLPSAGLPYDRTSIALQSTSSYTGSDILYPANVNFTSAFSDKMNQSPSPDTPGLSYSPSSTESSSGGDRTIQMSTFPDDNMGSFTASQSCASSESWQYEETANFSVPASMGQGQSIQEKQRAYESAPQIYVPSDSPPPMYNLSLLDTLLSKSGPYGPDMKGSYPREMAEDYLAMDYSFSTN